MSSDQSDSLYYESDIDRYNFGSSGAYYFCAFCFCFEDSVGSVSIFWYSVFVPIGDKSYGDIFVFDVFVPIGVESKGGQLIKTIWLSNSLFSFQT